MQDATRCEHTRQKVLNVESCAFHEKVIWCRSCGALRYGDRWVKAGEPRKKKKSRHELTDDELDALELDEVFENNKNLRWLMMTDDERYGVFKNSKGKLLRRFSGRR